MKIALHAFLALMFAAFAYLNLNDPDPWTWVTAYLAVAILFGMSVAGMAYRPATAILLVLLTIWMLSMTSGMIQWFSDGMPSITSEMRAHEPHIEVVREFLGLLIAVIALAHLYRTQRGSSLRMT